MEFWVEGVEGQMGERLCMTLAEMHRTQAAEYVALGAEGTEMLLCGRSRCVACLA